MINFYCPATPLGSHIRHIYIVLHYLHTYIQSKSIIISKYKKGGGGLCKSSNNLKAEIRQSTQDRDTIVLEMKSELDRIWVSYIELAEVIISLLLKSWTYQYIMLYISYYIHVTDFTQSIFIRGRWSVSIGETPNNYWNFSVSTSEFTQVYSVRPVWQIQIFFLLEMWLE